MKISVQKYKEFIESLFYIISMNEREDIMNTESSVIDISYAQIRKDFAIELKSKINERLEGMKNVKDLVFLSTEKASLNSWLRNYVPDNIERKKLIDYCMRENNPPTKLGTMDFLSLSKIKHSHDKWIVHGLLQRRCLILLTAYAKVGKTLMGYDLCTAVALGKKWLNRKTTQSRVLLIQNEEALPESSKKVFNNKIGELELTEPEEYASLLAENRLIVIKDVDISEDSDYIFQVIQDNNIDLVICDSLTASLNKVGYNETSPEVTPILYDLQSKIHHHNICFILVHHATKAENSESTTDRLKSAGGRSGIARANDGQIYMKVDKEDQSRVIVYFDLRHGAPTNFTVQRCEREAMSWHWEVIQETQLSGESLKLQNRILRLLHDVWDEWSVKEDPELPIYGLSVAELSEILELDNNNVIKVLNYMLSLDAIEIRNETNPVKRIYHLGVSGVSILDDYLYDMEREDELKKLILEADREFIDKLVTLEDVSEIKRELDSITKEDRIRIKGLMTKDESNYISLKLYPPKYAIGDNVKIKGTDIVREVEFVKYDNKLCDDLPKEDRHLYKLSDTDKWLKFFNLEEG